MGQVSQTCAGVLLFILHGVVGGGCGQPTVIVMPNPGEARSVLIGLRTSDEQRFSASALPARASLPSRFESAEGLLLYGSSSLGALRLEPGVLVASSDGVPLADIGREAEQEEAFFTFTVGGGVFSDAAALPDWAAGVKLATRDVASDCKTPVLVGPLDLPDYRYREHLTLPDGSILLVSHGPVLSWIHRLEDLSASIPGVREIGSVPGDIQGAAVVGDQLVLHGVVPGTPPEVDAAIISAPLEPLMRDGLWMPNPPEVVLTGTSRTLRKLYAPNPSLNGLQAVDELGGVYRRDGQGTWTQTLASDNLPNPTACEQPLPEIAARVAEGWRDDDAFYIAFSFGMSTGTEARVMRLDPDGTISMDCMDPRLTVVEPAIASFKITGTFTGGPTRGGFIAHRQQSRFRLLRDPVARRWDRGQAFIVESDLTELIRIDLGVDVPPAYLWAGDSGLVGVTFAGGPGCSPLQVLSDEVRWVLPLDDKRFLVAPLDGIPSVLRL